MSKAMARSGAVAGALAAILIAAGHFVLGDLPAPGASGQDVYAFFLDDRDSLRLGAGITVIGLAMIPPFLAILRAALDPHRRTPASAVMMGAGLIATAGLIFSAAAIGALAIGAENAAPESSRATLDLAQAVGAAAGIMLTVKLLAAAVAIARPGSGAPARLGWIAVLAALGCALWIAPLFTDSELLEPGSVLGTDIGLGLLLLWLLAASWWVRGRGGTRV